MIEDKDILTVCKYWASILRCKDVPFDELVNEAYLVIKTRVNNNKLTDPELLQKWSKWTMVHYIQRERFALMQCKSTLQNTPDISREDKDVGVLDFIEDKSFDFQKFHELKEELDRIVDRICTNAEKKLLDRYIKEDKTFRQIADEDSCCFQAVYFRYQRAVKKLRKEYVKRQH